MTHRQRQAYIMNTFDANVQTFRAEHESNPELFALPVELEEKAFKAYCEITPVQIMISGQSAEQILKQVPDVPEDVDISKKTMIELLKIAVEILNSILSLESGTWSFVPVISAKSGALHWMYTDGESFSTMDTDQIDGGTIRAVYDRTGRRYIPYYCCAFLEALNGAKESHVGEIVQEKGLTREPRGKMVKYGFGPADITNSRIMACMAYQADVERFAKIANKRRKGEDKYSVGIDVGGFDVLYCNTGRGRARKKKANADYSEDGGQFQIAIGFKRSIDWGGRKYDWDRRNYAAIRLFLYVARMIVQKSDRKNIPEKVRIFYDELVRAGMYSNNDSARVGVDNAIPFLSGLYVLKPSKVSKAPDTKCIITGVEHIVGGVDVETGHPEAWEDLTRTAVMLPDYIDKLTIKSMQLIFYMLSKARSNAAATARNGCVRVSVLEACNMIALPDADEERKLKENILNPLDKCAEEINKAQLATYGNEDIKLSIEYEPTSSTYEAITKGKIKLTLTGEPLASIQRAAEEAAEHKRGKALT